MGPSDPAYGTDMSSQLDAIVAGLGGKREGSSWRCRCPAHDGHSLIATEKDGKVLFKCHNGCSQTEVITALREIGLWSSNGAACATAARLEAEYLYMGIDGETVAAKGRFLRASGSKTFRWRRFGCDDWDGLKGLKERDLPLYGAHLLTIADGPVFVVEGEKGANACLDAGLLAVCPPGGAATKDFGDQLKALAGRDVVCWPDNDDEGRALMQRIELKLQGVAASVRTITPEVPPKGDAFDYFRNGGTKDGALADVAKIKTTPWVEEAGAGYLVGLPEIGGVVYFRFDDLEERHHHLGAQVTAHLEAPGMSSEPFTARTNLLSLSHTEAFCRQLDKMFTLPTGFWTRALNRAAQMVIKAHGEHDPGTSLGSVETDVHVGYSLRPFIVEDGPSMAFGQGGCGKTYIALTMAVHKITGTPFLGQPCQRGRVLFLDYESTDARIKARLLRILRGLEVGSWDWKDFVYWPGRGLPLPDILPALKRRVREQGIDLIMVDSAALACGGDPIDSPVALRYFNALASLSIPSLSLAHTTKDEKADKYPYGSIFWHNSARATWNVKLTQEEDGVAHVGLFNRKANDERLAAPIGVRLAFGGEDVRLTREDVAQEFVREMSLSRQIRESLRYGAKSVKQLTDDLDAKQNSVWKALKRMQTKAEAHRLGDGEDGSGLWGLAGHDN